MYVITREDITPGYQGVQSIHAGIQFVMEHPEFSKVWYKESNYLGWLSVADEATLIQLIEQAIIHGIPFSVFREPDIGDQITAIALAPGPKSKKLCGKLKLALKEEK